MDEYEDHEYEEYEDEEEAEQDASPWSDRPWALSGGTLLTTEIIAAMMHGGVLGVGGGILSAVMVLWKGQDFLDAGQRLLSLPSLENIHLSKLQGRSIKDRLLGNFSDEEEDDAYDEEEEDTVQTRTLPQLVRYSTIRAQIPRGQVCLGVGEDGEVITCDFAQLMTMWICGGSGTGKSNTVALKIDEAIRLGRNLKIILIDPHARKPESLYNRIRCYEQHFLFRVAVSEDEIFNALDWFREEFDRRLAQGNTTKTDILLVVDEVSNVVDSDDPEIGKLIKKIAKICGGESRGFGMFGWFISQDAAGLSWLRKRAITVIAHKLNMMSERKLACNDDPKIARSMDNWPRGRVAVYGLNFQRVMVAQMPDFTSSSSSSQVKPMEIVQPISPLPDTEDLIFLQSSKLSREDGPEANGEANGRTKPAENLPTEVVLKNFLNEAGKMRANGQSMNAILRAFGLPENGRVNQNLKVLLDALHAESEN